MQDTEIIIKGEYCGIKYTIHQNVIKQQYLVTLNTDKENSLYYTNTLEEARHTIKTYSNQSLLDNIQASSLNPTSWIIKLDQNTLFIELNNDAKYWWEIKIDNNYYNGIVNPCSLEHALKVIKKDLKLAIYKEEENEN